MSFKKFAQIRVRPEYLLLLLLRKGAKIAEFKPIQNNMKINLLLACFMSGFLFSCGEDQNPKSGDFYVKATINPPIESGIWGVGSESFVKTSTKETSLQSDPINVKAKENILVEVGIWGGSEICHSITADFFYLGKVIKSVKYEMSGPITALLKKCKDGHVQNVNLIIPS